MKIVTIMQSNYIPWKGYFDLARCADCFVFLDTVQFTKGDWRNRNKILLKGQPHWLTIPVVTSGKLYQTIQETEVKKGWAMKHWQTFQQAYKKAPYFNHYKSDLLALFEAAEEMTLLSEVNRLFFHKLCDWLAIETAVHDVREVAAVSDDPTQRLIDIIRHFDGTHYLSGPAAKNYLEEEKFEQAGIEIVWADYGGYPDYPQQSAPFNPYVSVLDLLMAVGDSAPDYLSDLTQGKANR